MSSPKVVEMAELLDQLINTDISGRGVIRPLHAAARKLLDKPMTLAAAELLQTAVAPEKPVIIATGWVDQPLVAPGCGESDGPPGAVLLARALRVSLKALPIILVDECLVEGMKKIARAAGFQCVPPEHLRYSVELNKMITLSILPFPVDPEEAKIEAARMIEKFGPAACIAIERGSMNDAGVIHNMAGRDTGETMAKLDYLFREARRNAIPTIGIGDGGNEIGMGNIAEAIRDQIPYGKKCQCPCGAGLAPSTNVDVLVTATISNWAAYAITAMLGALTGADVINTAEREKEVLSATAGAGFHDPIAGSVTPSVDGCRAEVQLAMVSLIREIVVQRQKG